MEYVNLIDYVGRPEEIEHVELGVPAAVVATPDCPENRQVVVVWKDGFSDSYSKDGRYMSDKKQEFIKKRNPTKKIKVYQREWIQYPNTSDYSSSTLWCTTIEEFDEKYRNCAALSPNILEKEIEVEE